MASCKKRPYAARQKLQQDRNTLLRQHCVNGGDMKDYDLIRRITDISALETDEAVKRLDLEHTKEPR